MGSAKRSKTTRQAKQAVPIANRTYRDSLFRMIFREKHNLLPLYNALNGTNYTETDDLQVVTLENAIYMNMKNDTAFVLADCINLYEHQSTYNPNMPLRNLFYISREYEALIKQSALYLHTKVRIPNPRFVVFYNGVQEQPESQLLKLSDLYAQQEVEPELELTMRMLNINTGYNQEIMEQCQILSEYTQYVDAVRSYTDSMPISEAVHHAVADCIRKGVLADFLTRYRQEAISMSIFEYDEEETLRLIRQDEYRLGREDGLEQGLEQGLTQGRRQEILRSVYNLMDAMKLNAHQAMEVLKVPVEERPFYVTQLQKK